jgi:predicted NodU family carbamoyl transferase
MPDTNTYVGHWFLDHKLPAEKNKYWDPAFIADLMPLGHVLSLDSEFTHHDSHLEIAAVFAGKDFLQDCSAIVADGFGSSGECLSIYDMSPSGYKLRQRWFGFDKSLGMLYQYATAFLGMKMHNHEYKMLAYEVHVHELDYDVERIRHLAKERANWYLARGLNYSLSGDMDPVVNLSALPETQKAIDALLSDLLIEVNAGDALIHDKRCIVSYYVQSVVEFVMLSVVAMVNPKNLLLSGGLFYNVKLNSLIAKEVKGQTCIMPVAGDQGAGLGVYQRHVGDLVWPEHLFWGERNLQIAPNDTWLYGSVNMDNVKAAIDGALDHEGFVNIVRGAMEFGPRALCNTSTLAIPDPEIGAKINRINDRTNEMPFALVVTQAQADNLFEDCDKIHKSLEYMICTRDFKPGKHVGLMGGAHYYPDRDVYTCRPQITSDPHLVRLLTEHGPLINTSFNFHGVPIVRDGGQIKNTHRMQRRLYEETEDGRFLTLIIRN